MADLSPDRWRFVSPYLDEAMELPEAERAAWLAQVRTRDATLADDLETLLDERGQASRDGFLEGAPRAPDAPQPLAGQKVGDWTLMSLIGQGGMGNVWLARRDDGRFEGRAAVKLLNASLVGRAGEERFRREGNILARLADPHIARLLDAGVSPSGQPYLVLEYVEGEPIDRHCDARSLGVEARLRLFLEVLEAVAHAHANLIVHRDIKPSNVMVGKDGQAKLLDFGIAKLLEGEGEGGAATALTREAGRALTPEFAAPEQMTGGAVTTATDVYALGILLYLLLTGRHPAGAALHSPGELVKAILETDPSRVSDAVSESRTQTAETRQQNAVARSTTPDGLRRQLEGDLDTIVAKALKKSPAERYASVTALADDLRRYLRHEPISARPDTLAYRTAKFVRRHPGGVAAAVLALAAALAGTVVIAAKEREARHQRDAAEAQLGRATAANEFLGFLLSVAAPPGRKFAVGDLLEQGERAIEKQFSGNDPLRAEMLATIGERYMEAESWEKAKPVLERAAKIAGQSNDPALQARALCSLALLRLATGETREAATALMEKTLASLPEGREYDLERGGCLMRYGEFGFITNDGESTIRREKAAIAVLDRVGAAGRSARLDAESTLAYGYYLAGQNRKAEEAFANVMKALEDAGRDRTAAAADVLNNWALVHFQGDIGKAEPLYRRALELRRSIEGTDAVSPTMAFNVAGVLYELGRYGEAEPLYEQVIQTAHARRDSHIEADATMQLSALFVETGELDRAAAQLQKMRPFFNTPTFDLLRRAQMAYYEGHLALARGDGARARDQFSESVAGFEKMKFKISLNVSALIGLARAELALGNAAAATAAARRAITMSESFIEKGSPSYLVGQSRLALGEAQLAAGEKVAARASFDAALEQLQRTLGPEHPKTVRARQFTESLAATR